MIERALRAGRDGRSGRVAARTLGLGFRKEGGGPGGTQLDAGNVVLPDLNHVVLPDLNHVGEILTELRLLGRVDLGGCPPRSTRLLSPKCLIRQQISLNY